MKKYILKVNYESGSVCFATDKCDLVDALNEFSLQLQKQVRNKGDLMPIIVSASIAPVWYTSICEEANNE